MVAEALELPREALRRDPTLAGDRRRREAILAIDPDVLCRRQRDGDAARARAAGARG